MTFGTTYVHGPWSCLGSCRALEYVEIFRTHNLSRQAAADLRLRLRSHWDRRIVFTN